MTKFLELKDGLASIDNNPISSNYIVSFYNGVWVDSHTPCITFSEFVKRENLSYIEEFVINYKENVGEISKQILLTDIVIDSIKVTNWNSVSDNDKAFITKALADKSYLFETKDSVFYAVRENSLLQQKETTPVNTALTVTPTDSKRYKIECEISTIGDIFSLLYNTFSEVTNLKVTPIFEAVPIKFTGGVCKTPDYTLILYPDGISLVFDPISRENGTKYVLDKDTDESVQKWLETMDSEQVYKLAQLTFRKIV